MKDVNTVGLGNNPKVITMWKRVLGKKPSEIENPKTTMKEYRVESGDMPIIRELLDGYIFRRIENGYGYVFCTEKDKEFIENSGNHIDLEEVN